MHFADQCGVLALFRMQLVEVYLTTSVVENATGIKTFLSFSKIAMSF